MIAARSLYLVVVSIVAAAAIGCGSIRTYRWPLAPLAEPHGQAPTIYLGNALPSETMREVALVEAVGLGTYANEGDITSALSAEASHYGADAVVRVKIDCSDNGACHGYGVAVAFIGPARGSNPGAASPR